LHSEARCAQGRGRGVEKEARRRYVCINRCPSSFSLLLHTLRSAYVALIVGVLVCVQWEGRLCWIDESSAERRVWAVGHSTWVHVGRVGASLTCDMQATPPQPPHYNLPLSRSSSICDTHTESFNAMLQAGKSSVSYMAFKIGWLLVESANECLGRTVRHSHTLQTAGLLSTSATHCLT
jgi:hypothetical protein